MGPLVSFWALVFQVVSVDIDHRREAHQHTPISAMLGRLGTAKYARASHSNPPFRFLHPYRPQ